MKARIKRIILNPLAFLHIMSQNTVWRVTAGVPKDAILNGFTIDPNTQNLILFVSHESFSQVDVMNEVAPLLDFEVRKIQ